MPLRVVSEAKAFVAAMTQRARFSMRSPCSEIVFSLKVVYLSRALIRVHSHGTLFSGGVVTTTANEKDAVCVHTTIPERKEIGGQKGDTVGIRSRKGNTN